MRDNNHIAGPGFSCFFSFLTSILLFSIAQLGWEFFRSTPTRTVLGGALCALFYSFCLIGVCNLEDCLDLQRIAGYGEVCVCLLTSLLLAATIHPVCITTCLLFSVISTLCLQQVAKNVYFTKERRK
ncbi:hypothetical protein Gasu2_23760 [Galdieria sulphuraria]|uniref:Uncharacterized protein n=1 Tax=Galdieria sulphuraria TaxID=130081 RepID=M2Y8Y4_GALSU|nr:uncharacterized protein Gasu_03120 [Galdieria sulphuraria]EME32538.1 hypothetical protein Gasu_03120 [Galdieria sulphuraria]GJD08065.1 hypothetical protein Gasu2_23760 [Galdieria sulphuraria]|eukprot:XP_005709058.1 hypothetical protein Gasu_03120 [Galdieria sulphuraria]